MKWIIMNSLRRTHCSMFTHEICSTPNSENKASRNSNSVTMSFANAFTSPLRWTLIFRHCHLPYSRILIASLDWATRLNHKWWICWWPKIVTTNCWWMQQLRDCLTKRRSISSLLIVSVICSMWNKFKYIHSRSKMYREQTIARKNHYNAHP